MNSETSLIIHLKPYYGYLILTEADENTVLVYFSKYLSCPFSLIGEIEAEAKTVFEAGKLLFESEYIESDKYSITKKKLTIRDEMIELIIDFVRTLIETAAQPKVKAYIPFIISYAMDYRVSIPAITKIMREKTGILTKKGAEFLKSQLEKKDKISFIELLSISLAIDVLSDGSFSAKDIIPESLLERLKVDRNSTFYIHPSLIKVLRKKFTEDECLEFIDRTWKTEVPFQYTRFNEEIEKKPDLSPDKVLELIYRIPQGKIRLPHPHFVPEGAVSFSWLLVYTFQTLATIKRELVFLTPWGKKSLNLLKVLSFEEPKVNYLPPKVKKVMEILYTKYFRILCQFNYTSAEKALIATATHIKLLDIINERSLNLAFIRFITDFLNSENEKEASYILERISYLLTCEETFFKRVCLALSTLTKEDMDVVEEFARVTLKNRTSFPKALLAFYPHIEDTSFYEAVIKNVASKKKEAKLYYSALKTVIFWSLRSDMIVKLKKIEKAIEDKMSPRVAVYLLQHKIISEAKLEKAKVLALTNDNAKKTYIKASCLHLCNALDFTDMMRECMKKLTFIIQANPEKNLLLLGKKLGKILDDTEFEVFAKLIQVYLRRNHRLSEHQINFILKDEDKAWKMLSAVEKIMKEKVNL